jgi:hypothetical protein
MAKLAGLPGKPFFDRPQNIGNSFAAWFRTEIAFAVNADADGVGFHIALSDYEHGMDFHLLARWILPLIFEWRAINRIYSSPTARCNC